MSIVSEYYFPSSDGKTLIHVNQWTPISVPVKAVVQIAHGVAEYGRRYAPFAEFLCANGFLVLAHDHLGHGLSVAPGGTRLHFGESDGWTHVVDDVAALQERTAKAHPGLPYFLFGHSMGSFITRTFLIRCPGRVQGAVICGTGHQSPLVLAAGKKVVAGEIKKHGTRVFSPKVEKLVFGPYNDDFAPARTKFDWISANQENVDAYIADPMCGEDATLGLMRDLLDGLSIICKPANVEKVDKNCPLFLISGDKDPVGNMGKGVEQTCRAYQKAGVRDVTMKLYMGLRHEILNEKTNKFVYIDVLNWLNQHI